MQNESWSPRIRKPSSIPERLSQGQTELNEEKCKMKVGAQELENQVQYQND
ncbi:14113_t:CDS:2 [Entrophospora sp. SA101]|nr:14113_t:CDS:2 [Entrophospora sp. SA101]